ncbi:hypothetical protein P7K49_028745 [Saguinus oedipus]|uniref:Uncharacterized protein n=1 Tax=Saguinus oedipus TaxID=9490 RepID=A0ABQ9U575_SAGOE|nr:hypothetical protein P7K49_028745 [Saguinus oedipus]
MSWGLQVGEVFPGGKEGDTKQKALSTEDDCEGNTPLEKGMQQPYLSSATASKPVVCPGVSWAIKMGASPPCTSGGAKKRLALTRSVEAARKRSHLLDSARVKFHTQEDEGHPPGLRERLPGKGPDPGEESAQGQRSLHTQSSPTEPLALLGSPGPQASTLLSGGLLPVPRQVFPAATPFLFLLQPESFSSSSPHCPTSEGQKLGGLRAGDWREEASPGVAASTPHPPPGPWTPDFC